VKVEHASVRSRLIIWILKIRVDEKRRWVEEGKDRVDFCVYFLIQDFY
jgi:hypothetical protein